MIWPNSAAVLKIFSPFQPTLVSVSPFSGLQGDTTREREGVVNSGPGGSWECADHFCLGRSSMTCLSICNFPVWALEATHTLA